MTIYDDNDDDNDDDDDDDDGDQCPQREPHQSIRHRGDPLRPQPRKSHQSIRYRGGTEFPSTPSATAESLIN